MYRARFAYVHALLLAVGAAGAVAFLGWTAFGQQVRVDTRRVPEPALTKAATVAELEKRLEAAPQTATGAEVAPQVASECPQVDIYELSDGAILVCHG